MYNRIPALTRLRSKIFTSCISNYVVCISISLFLVFNFTHCSLEKPSAPSWEVEVAIPLISKAYTMKEIADDESSINLDSTGTLIFEEVSKLDEYYVGNQLNIENKQDYFTLDLGSFTIDTPGSESTTIELREIFPEADNLHRQEAIIPPFSFGTNKKGLNAYDGFAFVVIDTGNISMQVENNLAVPLGAPITIEIWDATIDTLIIAKTKSEQILPGENKSFQVKLAGKKLSNQLAIRMSADSPGSDGSIQIDANSSFVINAEISDLKVLEALAEIPRQVISNEDEVTITDSLVIIEAAIEQGTVELALGGNFPLDAWIHYRFPDFFSPTGQELANSIYVNRNSIDNIQIDLANYTLRPQLADFGQQKIHFNWSIETMDSGTEMIHLKSQDLVNASFILSDMNFSSVSGKVGEEKIEVTQKEIEIDIPADMDSIFFETAQMELTINNGINFPANINFDILGRNESGAVSQLKINGFLKPATQPGVPVKTVIVIDQQNSNINDFLSILPSLIQIDGKVTIGDKDWIGTVTSDDFVDGEVKITAPLSLKLPSQTIESDVNDLNIDDDVKADIIENLSSGAFLGEISNHLPMGATIEVMFSQNEVNLFAEPILKIGPLRAEAGTLDGSGYVANAQDSEISFALSETQMRTFLKSPLYSGVRVKLDGTNGKYVKVRGSDFLKIKAYSTIKVKINQD